MLTHARQGELDASTAYVVQRAFGLSETLVFTLEGVGVTLMCGAALLHNVAGMVVGLAVTAAAIVLLFGHLGHPTRAWRAFARWQTSWISRGALALTLFMGVGLANLAAQHGGASVPGPSWLPLLQTAQIALGAFILIYPGGLLAQSPAIPFWQSAGFFGTQILSGITSGVAWVLVLVAMAGEQSLLDSLVRTQLALLGLLLCAIVAHVSIATRSRGAARESARQLLQGPSRLSFAVLGCGSGVVVALGLTLGLLSANPYATSIAAAAACAKTVGDIALRHSLVRVGIYDRVR